jgi:hypothetical protein
VRWRKQSRYYEWAAWMSVVAISVWRQFIAG